jgi:putative transposase
VSRFVDEHRGRFGVEPICGTLGVSASAYYGRAIGRRSSRAIADERLLERICEVHAANYHAYGYRRTCKALLRAGEQVGRDRVKRLMRVDGIQGAPQAPREAVADHQARFRRSPAPRPGAARLHYVQARPALGRRPVLSALLGRRRVLRLVIDAYSRRVVGWQLAPHMRTTLVLDALRMALGHRRPGADVALVHHSDRGSQYTSIDYTQTLEDHGVLASVGSVGDAYDNALAESFVDSFKTELIADRVWTCRSQLELAVVEYIGSFNHDRLHQALGDIPPAELEQTALSPTPRPRLAGCAGEHPVTIRKPTNPVSAKASPAQDACPQTSSTEHAKPARDEDHPSHQPGVRTIPPVASDWA